jgi:hypothetical protein
MTGAELCELCSLPEDCGLAGPSSITRQTLSL